MASSSEKKRCHSRHRFFFNRRWLLLLFVFFFPERRRWVASNLYYIPIKEAVWLSNLMKNWWQYKKTRSLSKASRTYGARFQRWNPSDPATRFAFGDDDKSGDNWVRRTLTHAVRRILWSGKKPKGERAARTGCLLLLSLVKRRWSVLQYRELPENNSDCSLLRWTRHIFRLKPQQTSCIATLPSSHTKL